MQTHMPLLREGHRDVGSKGRDHCETGDEDIHTYEVCRS